MEDQLQEETSGREWNDFYFYKKITTAPTHYDCRAITKMNLIKNAEIVEELRGHTAAPVSISFSF
jgi:hypothetical protein